MSDERPRPTSVTPGLHHHYGGGLYDVLNVAFDSTNGPTEGRWVVIYRSRTTGRLNVRDVAQWVEPVLWPDGATRPRFVREPGNSDDALARLRRALTTHRGAVIVAASDLRAALDDRDALRDECEESHADVQRRAALTQMLAEAVRDGAADALTIARDYLEGTVAGSHRMLMRGAELAVGGWATRLIGRELFRNLDASGAVNNCEWTITSGGREAVLSAQWKHGLTPSQQRDAATKRAEKAEDQLAVLRGAARLLLTAVAGHASTRAREVDTARRALALLLRTEAPGG